MKYNNTYTDENNQLLESLIEGRFLKKWKNSTSTEGLVIVTNNNHCCTESTDYIDSKLINHNLSILEHWISSNNLRIPYIQLQFKITNIDNETISILTKLSQSTNTLYLNQKCNIERNNIVQVSRITSSKEYSPEAKTTFVLTNNNLKDFIDSSKFNFYDSIEDRTTEISNDLISAFYTYIINKIKKQGEINFCSSVLEKTNCNIGRFLCLDIENMTIIPCSGLNSPEFILGELHNEKLVARNITLAIRLYVSIFSEYKQLVHCNLCKYGPICRLSQYCKNFIDEKDIFLISEETCKLLTEKNKIFTDILKTLDISSILDSNNMFEELKDLIDKED